MDVRERILADADELICTFGVKRITMDDIARRLGISKKTIYHHFKDKNELIYILFQNMLEKHMAVMDAQTANAGNAVEEVFLVVTHLQGMLSKMNPMVFYDLQRYHPEVWTLFKNFRYAYMKECLLKNLKWGVEEGFFRKELNHEIIALFRLEQVDMVFNQIVFPPGKFMLLEVMTEITEHYLYGLCTLKGHKLINKYKQITEE
ncbi:TetR/AcrR family transcriptional regulator [Pedobacter sp. P351]|uniref:TetR/AcrR family transcriptional regulator n=1 Tax=Pedobacter superstes TaxID=3133441 RepID=UPI0030A573AF